MTMQHFDVAPFRQRFDRLLERDRQRTERPRVPAPPPKNLKTYSSVDGQWVEVATPKAESQQIETKIATEAEIREEFAEIMRDLCPLYLELAPQQCAEVRQMFAGHGEFSVWILEVAGSAARRFHRREDVYLLREGLAAVSIENSRLDYRDTLITLADLFVRAEEVGVDPRPHFLAVAELSNTDRTYGQLDSVAQILREFEKSAVVKDRRTMNKSYRDIIASRS